MSHAVSWWSDERALRRLTDLTLLAGFLAAASLGILYILGVLELRSDWTTLQYLAVGSPFGVILARQRWVEAHSYWQQMGYESTFEELDGLLLGCVWIGLLGFSFPLLPAGLYLFFGRKGGPPRWMDPRPLWRVAARTINVIKIQRPRWHKAAPYGA